MQVERVSVEGKARRRGQVGQANTPESGRNRERPRSQALKSTGVSGGIKGTLSGEKDSGCGGSILRMSWSL